MKDRSKTPQVIKQITENGYAMKIFDNGTAFALSLKTGQIYSFDIRDIFIKP